MSAKGNLHHVGVPPVRVFLREWRQDPCACRDRPTCIISHSGSLRHILFLLIIITTWITVITVQQERERRLSSFSGGRQVALHRSNIMTGCQFQ